MGGKKPSKRKASTKQTTSAVRKIIDSADDVERSKRAKTVAGAVQSSSSLVGQPSAPTTVTVSVTNTGYHQFHYPLTSTTTIDSDVAGSLNSVVTFELLRGATVSFNVS